jgi:hypothetical protein
LGVKAKRVDSGCCNSSTGRPWAKRNIAYGARIITIILFLKPALAYKGKTSKVLGRAPQGPTSKMEER